jgi:hypothetical protein
MTKLFVSNAFSMNMIASSIADQPFDMQITPVMSPDEFFDGTDVVECLSNQATCDLFNVYSTEHKVVAENNTVSLDYGDSMLVMQYNGPRLEKGLTSLPAGGTVRFFIVEIVQASFV